MFLIVHGLYQVYQFFVHTRLVGTLGPLEWLFATPSVHRVHHGRPAECLDKNYGGFLNVWDRLGGTFQPEACEPEYGITTGISSWSPYWANLHYFAHLARCSRSAPNLTAAVTPAASTLTVSNLRPSSVALTKDGAGALAVNTVRADALQIAHGTVSILAGRTQARTSNLHSLSVAAVWILSAAVLATLLGVAGFFDG